MEIKLDEIVSEILIRRILLGCKIIKIFLGITLKEVGGNSDSHIKPTMYNVEISGCYSAVRLCLSPNPSSPAKLYVRRL